MHKLSRENTVNFQQTSKADGLRRAYLNERGIIILRREVITALDGPTTWGRGLQSDAYGISASGRKSHSKTGVKSIERRRMTSRYHGSKMFGSQKRELWQRRRRRERQKSNNFILGQNNNFAHASRFSALFFAIVARMRQETS